MQEHILLLCTSTIHVQQPSKYPTHHPPEIPSTAQHHPHPRNLQRKQGKRRPLANRRQCTSGYAHLPASEMCAMRWRTVRWQARLEALMRAILGLTTSPFLRKGVRCEMDARRGIGAGGDDGVLGSRDAGCIFCGSGLGGMEF